MTHSNLRGMLVSDWLICSGATTSRLLPDALSRKLATYAVYTAVQPLLGDQSGADSRYAYAAINAARHLQPRAQSQRYPAEITGAWPKPSLFHAN